MIDDTNEHFHRIMRVVEFFRDYFAFELQHKRGRLVFKHRGIKGSFIVLVLLVGLGFLGACAKKEPEIVFDVDKLKQQCDDLTLKAIDGDIGPIYTMIKEDYKQGTSQEAFQDYLEARLNQSEEFDSIISSEFTQSEHPLDKYPIGSVIVRAKFSNGFMTFTYQFNEANELIGTAITFEVRSF